MQYGISLGGEIWRIGLKKIILAVIAALVVAGGIVVATADSKQEQAGKLYDSARDLVVKGDNARAMVELRNALQKDPDLRDARMLFGDLLRQAGRKSDAFGQYRQVFVKNPDDVDAARQLALISFEGMAWDDARTYVADVLAKRPDDTEIQAISAGLDYREAVSNKDDDKAASAVEAEKRLLAQDPKLVNARRILIAAALRENNLEHALELTDQGLALMPEDRDMNNTRLFLLEQLGRTAAVEQQLLEMIARFPKDENLGRTLVRVYVREGRIDDAESILRKAIDPNSDKVEPRMVLLRFLSEIRSPAAMRTELEKVLAENPLPKDVAADPMRFKALKAQTDFVLGETDKAMAEMEGLLKDAEPSTDTDQTKVQLAKMRWTMGNLVGARALIEEVLVHDASQVEAMKMKAGWLIDEDQTEPAVAMLRDALADAPNDPQVLMLMARAYEREGRPELMADMMARAVDAANQAPAESMAYARWLLQKREYPSAETVLINALRRQSNNINLLAMLAQTHIGMKDWARAQQDIDAISQRFDTDQARDVVSGLKADILAGQGRSDELTQFLDQIGQDPDKELAARIAIIRTTVANGQLDLALTDARKLAQDKPGVPVTALLVAQILIANGNLEEGETGLRALLQTQPDYLPAMLALQGLQIRQGKLDDALKTVDDGLAKAPDNRALSMAKAFVLEKRGDIDGAVAIYDGLYAANSNDMVVANNLASLLASTRDDQASLDRAWTVARRLNGATVPAFLDTYGWISFRRGDTAGAVPVLETAAQGLPDDPSVAYHLGRAYAAQGAKDKATAEYARAELLLANGAIGYPDLAQDLIKARSELK